MRGKHHGRAVFGDGSGHFFDWRGRKRRLRRIALTGGEHARVCGDAALLENLRPTEAEKAVADNQAFFISRQLSGHGFHARCAAAGHHGGIIGTIHFFQRGGNFAQGRLKLLRHVVEGAVGVNHGIFEQAVFIDFGAGQGGHAVSPFVVVCGGY